MPTIDFNGSKVWYRQSGSGEPILFLHNGGNDHRIWDHQVAHFERTNRVIVVDHIGYGQSDSPEIDYDLPLFTSEVETIVDALGLAPVTLAGHCIGGAMALNYTWRHPEKVRRLVLFNVATRNTLCAGPLEAVYKNFSQDRQALLGFSQQMEATGLTREQTDQNLQNQFGTMPVADDPEFAEHIHKLWNKKGQMRALYNNLAQFDSFGALDSFVRPAGFPPTLLFWGAKNNILPCEGSSDLKARIQPDIFHLVEGGGHLLMREKADEVNREMDAFFATHAAGGIKTTDAVAHA